MLSAILASLTISTVSFVGGLLLLSKKEISQWIHTFVSFAAGVMLAAAFLDLFPEAQEAAGENPVFLPAFVGIVLFFFLERFVVWFHHHDGDHGTKPAAVLVLIGDAVHNFIDGLAIAATFIANPAIGITTTLAIAAHEIPQELADFSVLIASGMKKTKALLFNFISGLTALLGAIIGFSYLDHMESVEWIFLSFTAGMFIYIACSDLIPELHENFSKKKQWIQSVPFLLGIGIMVLLIYVLER